MSYSPHAFGITKGESAGGKFYLADDNGDIEFQDSDKIIFGDGADVSLFWDNGNSIFKIGTDNSGKAITIGNATSEVTVADNLTVTGDLTVNGTTTSVNQIYIDVTNAFVFEGASSNAHETTLGIVEPTADATINLPAMANAGSPYYLPVLAAASTTAITSTPEELNKIDGGTAREPVTIVDADGILVNDGGTMKMVLASSLKTYASGGGETAADDITTGDDAVTITTSVGNITIDAAADNTDIIFKGTDATVDITMLILDGSEAGAATFNSTVTATGFTIGSAAITEAELEILDGASVTTAELNLLDGSVAGTAVASKAVVLDASKNIATIGTIDCGAITSTGSSSFGATSFGDNNITNVGNIALDSITADGSTITITGNTTFADGAYDFDIASHDGTNGLKLGGALVTATAAELNILDGVTSAAAELNLLDGSSAGTVANSKAVIYSAAGIVQATDLKVPDGGGIHNATVADMILLNAAEVVFKDGNFTVDIASHDAASYGLKLGGTLITATAAELNILDGVTATAGQLNNTITTHTANSATLTSASARIHLVDTSSNGNATITLTANQANGTTFTIKKKTSDANTVTIATSDNIDGSSSDVVLYYHNESVTLVSDSANYFII